MPGDWRDALRSVPARVRAFLGPLVGLFGRLGGDADLDAELDAEIQAHLEMAEEQYRASGMSPEEARRAARRDFGGVDQVKARHREARGDAWLDGMVGDTRIAVRRLVGRPGFTVVAVATLGLGVGATTAMFSAVNSVLLRDLPYRSTDDIFVLRQGSSDGGAIAEGISIANTADVGDASAGFAHVAAAEGPHGLRLSEDGRAFSLRTWLVTEGFLEVMGVEVLLGRGFAPDEFEVGNERVVLLSHELWRDRYAGDPAVIGRSLVLDGAPHTVVGVLPPEFQYPSAADIWAPRPVREMDLAGVARSRADAIGVVRLADGVDPEQTRLELERIAAELGRLHPESAEGIGFRLTPLREHLFGEVRTPLLLLLGAVFLVLLIAASNVAGLQVARGSSRAREYALRGALGADSMKLVRMVAVESLVLGLLGSAAGGALAYFGVDVIRALAPNQVPRIEQMGVDAAALAFAVVVAVGSAVAAGLVPAIRAARQDPRSALGDGARGSTIGGRTRGLGDRLVVAEIAMALVLTIGAGLLVQSYDRLRGNELGFDPADRLAAQVWAYDQNHQPDLEFFREAIDELRNVPGVEAAGLTTDLPLADNRTVLARPISLGYSLGDAGAPPGPTAADGPVARYAAIDPGYPDAMGIAVTRGREFTDLDDAESLPVAMVNEAFVRRHFADGDPLGTHVALRTGVGTGAPREIIGVLSDVRRQGYDSAVEPEVYLPLAQSPSNGLTFVLRTTGDAGSMIPAVREAMWTADPDQAVWAVRPLNDLLGDWTRQRRFNTALLLTFSILALALAAVGVYGLVSHGVEARSGELAIRRAMGGQRAHVLRMVLGQGLMLAFAGIGLGLAAALALSGLLRGMLFGIGPLDGRTFAAVSLLVLLVAVIATLIPAARATRVGPMTALGSE